LQTNVKIVALNSLF